MKPFKTYMTKKCRVDYMNDLLLRNYNSKFTEIVVVYNEKEVQQLAIVLGLETEKFNGHTILTVKNKD